MITDGSKEQVLEQFCKKCCQACSHVKQTKPYWQWSNAAKGSIQELKNGIGREMVRSQAPKQLWDDGSGKMDQQSRCIVDGIHLFPNSMIKGCEGNTAKETDISV